MRKEVDGACEQEDTMVDSDSSLENPVLLFTQLSSLVRLLRGSPPGFAVFMTMPRTLKRLIDLLCPIVVMAELKVSYYA